MEKAASGPADIVVLDLEDAVSEENKTAARRAVAAFLAAHKDSERLWVRINSLDTCALLDLATIVPARPAGIMLPKANGPQDVEILHHCLAALEVANGIDAGATEVVAMAVESAGSMFTTAHYRGGSQPFVFELARSLCLVGAAAAGVAAIDTVYPDYRDLSGLRRGAEQARRAGFRGMLAIHPDQVTVINEVFTPSAEPLQAARAIIDLFAAHGDAGAIGRDGVMLDRPHLARARAVLAAARGRRAEDFGAASRCLDLCLGGPSKVQRRAVPGAVVDVVPVAARRITFPANKIPLFQGTYRCGDGCRAHSEAMHSVVGIGRWGGRLWRDRCLASHTRCSRSSCRTGIAWHDLELAQAHPRPARAPPTAAEENRWR